MIDAHIAKRMRVAFRDAATDAQKIGVYRACLILAVGVEDDGFLDSCGLPLSLTSKEDGITTTCTRAGGDA
jgi:hypothetical protein